MKQTLKFLKSKLPEFLATFAATINAITDGMSYAWSSPIIPILESPGTPVKVTASIILWLESIYLIAPIFCMPLTIYLLDKFGRKPPILLSSALHLIHWILLAFAQNVPMLIIARLLTGFSGNLTMVASPMYIAEIAHEKIRGFLSSFLFTMQLVGVLIMFSIGPFVTIQISSLIGAVFPCLQLILLPFMPETPYFLFMKGRDDKAKNALQFLRGSENIDSELEEIKTAVQRQSEEQGRIKDLFVVKSNRKGMVIVSVLNAAEHLCGSTVMFMTLHTILKRAGGVIKPNTASITFSGVMLVSCLISSIILDKLGRKLLLVVPCLMSGFSQLILAIYFTLLSHDIDLSAYSWVPIADIILFAASFKFGLGLIPIVMTGELFPTSVKSIAMTGLDLVYVVFGIICIYLYDFLERNCGDDIPFYLFSAVAFSTAIFSYFCVPETKGKTLEEIQVMLKQSQ